MNAFGIDLSKEKFDVSFINETGNEQVKVVKNNLKSISLFLSKLPQDAVLCAEHTGSYGDLLVFLSNQSCIPISLVPGYTIKHSFGLVKGKNDPLDARRIREYAERFSDKLEDHFYQSENLSELRELFVTRKQLVKMRKQLVTAQKSVLPKPFQSIFAQQKSTTVISCLDEQIQSIDEQMQSIIDDDDDLAKSFYLAISIVGVGPVLATELIIKTENFNSIDTARKAASFAGVCPFPNASGKMVAKNKTSQFADKKLKTTLHMAARAAARHNKDYALYYKKKELEGKPYFIIINNISNKLLRTIYSVIQNEKPFDKNYICPDPREKNVA